MTLTAPAIPDTLIDLPQWRGESIQLIDWGNMCGHTQVDLDGHSALMTGESGAGKSTIFDAVLALMQSSRTRFNSASNAAGGGRARSGQQRNELTYLTGKLDDFERPDGEIIARALRPVTDTSRWGALAMTFISSMGERYTIIRAYYVPRGCSDRASLTDRCASINGPFDLRQLEPAATERFDMRSMRALGLTPYEGPGQFHDAMFHKLGFGRDGSKVVDLLRRIQSGADVSSVDALFSDVVLEQPATFDQADRVVDSFDDLKTTYLQMTTAAEKLDVLRPIVEMKADLDTVADELSGVASLRLNDPGDTAFTMWAAQIEHTHRTTASQDANDRLPAANMTLADARTHVQSTKANVRALDKALDDENGELNDLKDHLAQTEADHARASTRRRAFDELIVTLGEDVVNAHDHASLMSRIGQLRTDVQDGLAGCESERDELTRKKAPLEVRLETVKRELKSLESRSSRIDEQLDATRNAIAQRLGWSASELPFIAELVDVHPDHEQWRVAAEAVLGGVARRLVVPAEHRGLFQRTINDMRIGRRIMFDFAHASATPSGMDDSNRLMAKLVFAPDHRLGGWLEDRIYRAGGRHLCVGDVRELAISDGESRVTQSGQVSERTSGAHGGGHTRILGFSNEDLIDELTGERHRLLDQLGGLQVQMNTLTAKRNALTQRWGALAQLDSYASWSEIDVDTLQGRIDELTQRLDELRSASDRIPMLEAQLKEANDAAKAATTAEVRADDAVKALENELAEHDARLEILADTLARLDRGDVTVSDVQAALCDGAARQVGMHSTDVWSVNLIARIKEHLIDQIKPLEDRHKRETAALQRVFSEYRRRWGDEANDSTDVDAYDEYKATLDRLEESGLDRVRDQWCEQTLSWSADDLLTLHLEFRDARKEIHDRIDSINELLREVPFGAAEDWLQLAVKDKIQPRVQDWLKELNALAANVGGLDTFEDSEARFHAVQARFTRIDTLIDKIREQARGTSADTTRKEILDVRRQVHITAHRFAGATGERTATYSSFASKSGGETQELTAFITGAALRFRLGSTDGSRASYTPVFLDEGFIKADGKFTGRAVKAWEALGFQLIVAAPVEKFSAMEPHLQRLFVISKDDTGRGYCDQLSVDEARAALGVVP